MSEGEIVDLRSPRKTVALLKEGRDALKEWLSKRRSLEKQTAGFVYTCYSIYAQFSKKNLTVEEFADVTDADIEDAVSRMAGLKP